MEAASESPVSTTAVVDTEPTTNEPATAKSALADNIAKKGSNAYYFAHAKNLRGEVAVLPPAVHGDPRLLEVVSPSASLAAAPAGSKRRAQTIVSYAWADYTAHVSVYVTHADLAAVPELGVQVSHTLNTAVLTIDDGATLHTLKLGPLYEAITGATVRRKDDRVTVKLSKREKVPWSFLNRGAVSAASGVSDFDRFDGGLGGDDFGSAMGDGGLGASEDV